jgi:hypothetical protein
MEAHAPAQPVISCNPVITMFWNIRFAHNAIAHLGNTLYVGGDAGNQSALHASM